MFIQRCSTLYIATVYYYNLLFLLYGFRKHAIFASLLDLHSFTSLAFGIF